MSKQLLSALNGDNEGKLKEFIDKFDKEPSIGWYPSAGMDFRTIIELYPKSQWIRRPPKKEIINLETGPAPPDIFIFTDYRAGAFIPQLMLDEFVCRRDFINIHIDYIEELPVLNLPLHDEIVWPEYVQDANRVFFIILRIHHLVRTIYVPIIYAFVENEAFFGEVLNSNNAIISYIIHLCYNAGGEASGGWLLNVLHKLKCRHLITGGNYQLKDGDKKAMELYPSIPKESVSHLTLLKYFAFSNTDCWPTPHGGDVSWYLVS